MSRVKVSRRKLLNEPDEFHSLSQRAWLWVHGHRDRAAMIAGGIVAAVLVVVGTKGWAERSRERRSVDVATAVGRYVNAQGTAIPAELQHELAALADRHAGSSEGAIARYFQAGALAAGGESEKARPIYEQFSKADAKDDALAVLSRVALAYFEQARGANDTALTLFEEILSIKDAAVPRAQIMMEVAAIHEKLGQPAEARRVYRNLLAEHPDGSWTTVAKQRLRLLPEGTTTS